MSKEFDPPALFDRWFQGQAVKATRHAKTVREKYRKSVLDFVVDDAERLSKALG